MRIEFNALRSVDRGVLLHGVLIVLSIAGIAAMSWHLGTLRAAVDAGRRALIETEREAEAIVLPDEDERRQWREDHDQLVARLLADAEVPLFFQDVTRLATSYRLQRFRLDTEERGIDPGDGTEGPESAARLGIPGYLVVTLDFSSDYRNAAEFIHAVGQLGRWIEFTSIDLRRNAPDVDVTMVLRVYKRQEAP